MVRRHSLLVRFFAISVLIAACSIGVTAWLATSATTGTIRQEQGEALTTDTKLYDQILNFAATHKNWDGVQPWFQELARQTGRRIALTTTDRKVLADTGGKNAPRLPVRNTAVVNPLLVDLTLKPTAPADQIDPRAVGPFALTADERRASREQAEVLLNCLRDLAVTAKIVIAPNGRARVKNPDGRDLTFDDSVPRRCLPGTDLADHPPATKTEFVANQELIGLLTACLDRTSPESAKAIGVRADPKTVDWFLAWPFGFTSLPPTPGSSPPTLSVDGPIKVDDVSKCSLDARRQQLAAHVAPAAQLFLTAPTGAEPQRADLSTAGSTRIALTALAILAVAMFAAWLSAVQLVRPVRAVTAAARRMGRGEKDVRVIDTASGELGELADAFNAMSERLDGAEKQRKAMVSDIAHELRTPLGNITGWLEATQDGLAVADPELVAMLLTESLLLEYLVNDLQDLAQADAGTLRLHPEPIDAADLLDQAAAAHQAEADENGVTLRSATRGQLELTADAARLRQALGNLVANAVRFTPSGGEVTVTGRYDGDHILLEVSDTGVGIAPDDLPHVFERFWRADKSRSRSTGGSGLGLAITRHLVEAHGGTATVQSIQGQGSTFRLRLPSTQPNSDAP
jgi:two-component system sensor histidine kinase BaeS